MLTIVHVKGWQHKLVDLAALLIKASARYRVNAMVTPGPDAEERRLLGCRSTSRYD